MKRIAKATGHQDRFVKRGKGSHIMGKDKLARSQGKNPRGGGRDGNSGKEPSKLIAENFWKTSVQGKENRTREVGEKVVGKLGYNDAVDPRTQQGARGFDFNRRRGGKCSARGWTTQ